MVGVPTVEESAKAVWQQLQPIMSKGHSPDKVFHDWLDLSIYALQRRDPEYLEIMKRYARKGENVGVWAQEHFGNALGALMAYMQQNCTDVLGQIFTTEITRGENGQFFTPTPVCELMAQLNMPEPTKDALHYADPCCGSGRMLIAMHRLVPNGTYFAADIDARCCKMTALNMLFRNATGIVVHCNSLTLEVWRAWETKGSYIWGGTIREVSESELPAVRKLMESSLSASHQHRAEPAIINKHGQLVLF